MSTKAAAYLNSAIMHILADHQFDFSFHDIWKRLLKAISPHRKQKHPSRREWADWARRLPRSAFIIWLGGHVADELITSKSRWTSYDEMVQAVAESRCAMVQCDAERFIERHYFGYLPIDNHQLHRLIRVFRKVVQRKLERHAKSRS